MSNLITRWGAPAWNRLKSYNFPARYVRHQNTVALRIDPITASSSTTDKQDATFRVGF
jgi:hypothetical protein